MNQESPHVGVTYSSHGTARAPSDRPWWWNTYPSWAYGYGYPWYGLPQTDCYLDPWTGAWVCPVSPWAFHPVRSTWFRSPYYASYTPRAVFALR